MLVSACGSSSDDALEPVETIEQATDTSSETGDEPAETTVTTEAETTTEATVSELARAEADIEAAIVGWHNFPRDTSKGDAGLPLEFTTDLLNQRLRDTAQRRNEEGTILRSRGGEMVRIEAMRVDLAAGTAEADICGVPDGEVVDAETGEVLVADDGLASTGLVYAKRVDGTWKLSEFFSSQASGDPEPCDIEGT